MEKVYIGICIGFIAVSIVLIIIKTVKYTNFKKSQSGELKFSNFYDTVAFNYAIILGFAWEIYWRVFTDINVVGIGVILGVFIGGYIPQKALGMLKLEMLYSDKIIINDTTIQASEIDAIELKKRFAFRPITCNVKVKNTTGTNLHVTKKKMIKLKEFCEVNSIQFYSQNG